jgi:outer membrane receptor for ferric coprogen and ferric-rhodotorulic acid
MAILGLKGKFNDSHQRHQISLFKIILKTKNHNDFAAERSKPSCMIKDATINLTLIGYSKQK